jgi:rare lipoprotein A
MRHMRTPGKESDLKLHSKSPDRRLLRNVFMASALVAVLVSGGKIRTASALSGHSQTTDGKQIRTGGAWYLNRGQRRSVRDKLLASPSRSFEGSGIASVYGGGGTASGERMNSGAMTAAHRTLPFGTRVTVTSNHTGRSVVVRINDRGPFVRGRVIDLSPAAARAIGVSGIAEVSLRVGG